MSLREYPPQSKFLDLNVSLSTHVTFFALDTRDNTPSSPTTTNLPPATPSQSKSLTTKQWVTHFYNAIAAAAKEQCRILEVLSKKDSGAEERESDSTGGEAVEGEGNIHYHWMVEWSQNVMQGSTYS